MWSKEETIRKKRLNRKHSCTSRQLLVKHFLAERAKRKVEQDTAEVCTYYERMSTVEECWNISVPIDSFHPFHIVQNLASLHARDHLHDACAHYS